MNEIAKQRISERVIEALEKEQLSKNVAGPMIGIHPSYLSCVVNPEKLNKCPDVSWEVLQKWVNSGLTIKQWAEKRQKEGNYNPPVPISEIKKEIIPEKKSSKESNAVLVGIVNDPKYQDLETSPREKTLISLLIEERTLLLKKLDPVIIKKIDTIDVLLKHYIS